MTVLNMYRPLVVILLFLLAQLPIEKAGSLLFPLGNDTPSLNETCAYPPSNLSEASPLPKGLHFDVVLYEKKEGSDEEFLFDQDTEKSGNAGYLTLTPFFLALLSQPAGGKRMPASCMPVLLRRHIRFRALLI